MRYDLGAGLLRTALRCGGTVVPLVLQRYEFWACLLLHLAVFLLFRQGYLGDAGDEDSTLHLSWDEMKIVGGVTTLVEVFYTNQCYGRYDRFYCLSRKLLGTLYDFAFEARLHLLASHPRHVRVACRWLLVAVILFFLERRSGLHKAAWQELERHHLLMPAEEEELQTVSPQQRSLILLQWSAEAVQSGCIAAKVPHNMRIGLTDKLVRARVLEQEILDLSELQVPFQYFHLLNLMVVVNSLLWAWGLGTTVSLFAPVVYAFSSMIFMGLLELAMALSDPFGEDEVDFPVLEWLQDFLQGVVLLVERPETSPLEERLASCDAPLETVRGNFQRFVQQERAGGGWRGRTQGSRVSREHEGREYQLLTPEEAARLQRGGAAPGESDDDRGEDSD